MQFSIKIPKNVSVICDYKKNKFFFIGPLGKISFNSPSFLYLKKKKNYLLLNFFKNLNNDSGKKLFLYKSIINNNLKGVFQGFKVNLILKGLGFKALLEGDNLLLKLGYSHDIRVSIPKNIHVNINKSNYIILKSISKLDLTQFADFLRKKKIPEPYKGKGILFKNEKILLKEGKKK